MFENRISLSAHSLILSTHALIVSGNAISLFTHALIASVRTLIALAHALIAPENPIRICAHALIASTLPSNTAYSSTVPSGDTPCLTAGDARRANPWESNTSPSDASGVAQQPTSARLSYSLHAFRATPPASLRGFPLALRGYHPRLSIVSLRRRRELLCVDRGAEAVQHHLK